MRFLKDGPSIPDDLLIARDEGRVVFFCGAGVSKARAGLSDFFGLAEEVIRRFGVPSDNAASLILNAHLHEVMLILNTSCFYFNHLSLNPFHFIQ